MRNLIKIYDDWEGKGAAILMAISVSLAFYEVLSRFFLHTSIDWSSEITIYSIVFCAILGTSSLIKKDEHVRVDFVLIRFNEERQRLLKFLNGALCFVFSAMMAYSGFLMVRDAFVMGPRSESTLETPLWIPYLLMPFAGILFSLRLIQYLSSLMSKINLGRALKDPLFWIYVFACLGIYGLLIGGYDPSMILVVGLLVFLVLGMPIAFALGVVCLVVLYVLHMIPMAGFSAKMFEGMGKYSFLSIPFFILSGTFMTRGGIAGPLLNFAYDFLKPIRGGFAIAVMVACIIFAALSGASVAIAAAVGLMALPMLMEKGYPKRLGLGLISVGGTLGSLIPPSGILILYGAVSGENIGDLFKGGIVPGIIIGVAFCILIFILCKTHGWGTVDSNDRFNIRSLGKNFLGAFWALLMPIIILGGIYSGIFTPTEAAAVAVFYAAVVCSMTYKKMKLKEYLPILEESAVFTGFIYFIVMTSTLFSFLVTMEQVSMKIMDLVFSLNMQPWLFLLIINISIFLMGFFIHPGAIILMAVPILHPVLANMNIDPIHFGILLAINAELGFVTPPFGMNIFVISGVCDAPVTEVVKGEIPFIIVLLAALLIITYFPALSLMFIN
jgi:C4-dicarboxylate transporter, DctM subunit